MNDIMSLEQLEKLSKNPNYKLSEAQIKRLETLRNEKYLSFKHDQTFQRESGEIDKHPTELGD